MNISSAENGWVTVFLFIIFVKGPQQATHVLVQSNSVFNLQLLESPTAEVFIAKLHQEFCVHMRKQGGHF